MARSSDTQDDELAEFLQRAEMVRQQVDGLAKGTLAAEDVKMPGQDNWAYAAASSRKAALALTAAEASAEERAAAVAQHRKWDAQRAARLAAEEADRWWRFARMQYGEGGVNAPGAAAAAAAVAREEERASGIAAQPRWRPGSKGAIDYSWWDKYAVNPDDEVTVAEARRLAEEKERAESEAFEKANPGFCMSFRKDELERAAADRAKAARAEELKAQGNAAYAAGDFPAALGRYHEALRLAPFNVPVLNNIAMAHLSLGDAPAAREFCSRTLHIEPAGSPAGVKALFRRAAAARALADAPSACADLTLAAKGDPKSTEVAAALLEARTAVEEGEKEARLGAAGAATASATASASAVPSPGTPATPSPLPLAPPSLAPDGLPSNAAIAESVALSDMTLLQLLARAKARLVGLDAHTPGTPQRTAELRALSRELRALSGRIGTDEDRVRVRACGVLDLASRLAVGIAERVAAGEGAEGAAPAPAPAPAGEALSTMAVLASLFLTLTPLLGNPRNRACLRASCTADAQRAPPTTSATGSALVAPDIPADSVLGAALALLRARDSDSAAAWCAAFGAPPSGGPAEVQKWQYQLLAPLAAFAEAYARPAACDPIGRAALASHAYISAGGVTLRLWQTVRVVREAPPSGIPVGALETLHSLASTLQFLASFDHTATLLSALTVGGGGVAPGAQQLAHGAGPAAAQAAAGPFAPMIKAVNEAVSGLAALAGQGSSAGASGSGSALKWDDAGRGTNPIPVLIQAILALMGRALIDSLGSLTQVEGGDAAAEDASFFQSPALLAVTGALSNLCAHEAFAAFACASALKAILPSVSSATLTHQQQAPQGVQHTCDFVLYPLLDMLRLRPMGTLVQGGGGGEPTWNAIRAAACSALANACAPSVPHAGEALEALAGAGGIPTLLGLLREGGVEGSRAALCSRAAMLLGRLASAPSGVRALGAAPTADAVLALLRLTLRGAGGEREEAGMVVDGLLRCLAVCAGAEGGAPRLLAAGACAVLVQALRAGALDSLKVGFSGKRVRSVGVGNALKTLIALCEGVGAGGGGEAAGARLLAEGACEAATEALMCPGRDSDANAPIVRKNAATAVAKLSLHAACKERLRSLRALEALVQLKELH